MLQAGSVCTSSIPKDALTAGCAAWCSLRQKTSHCEFCKCRSCEFCVPVELIDHVYASAGASMVDCEDAIEVSPPLEEVSIDMCKAACDDAFPECLAFDYSGRGGRCTLRVGDGEPVSFCVQLGASTFWRVEVPSADADDARVAAANAAEAESEAAAEAAAEAAESEAPRRIIVQGERLLDSSSGEELLLHGVNIFLDYLRFDDIALLRKLLPAANLVRLVGVFWHDAPPAPPPTDGSSPPFCAPADRCCVDDESTGYFAPHCLDALRTAVQRLADAGFWVIIAAKARFAAGESYPEAADVFHDTRLASAFEAMWRHIAGAMVDQPMLAGFEVMSEPRSKVTEQATVRRFYESVCSGVHLADRRIPIPCVVGPTPYYKVWQLNSSMILQLPTGAPMPDVLYTFDFYDPWDFITAEPAAEGLGYPGDYPCGVAFRGWVRNFCDNASQVVRVDRSWLETLLDYPSTLARTHRVPVFSNQWGVKHSVRSGRLAYASDVAGLFEERRIHSALWIWRSYRNEKWGFELVHEDKERRETEDVPLMRLLNGVWSGQVSSPSPSLLPPPPPQEAESLAMGGRFKCSTALDPLANCWSQRCCSDPAYTCYVNFPTLAHCRTGACPAGWACSFASAGAPSLPPRPPLLLLPPPQPPALAPAPASAPVPETFDPPPQPQGPSEAASLERRRAPLFAGFLLLLSCALCFVRAATMLLKVRRNGFAVMPTDEPDAAPEALAHPHDFTVVSLADIRDGGLQASQPRACHEPAPTAELDDVACHPVCTTATFARPPDPPPASIYARRGPAHGRPSRTGLSLILAEEQEAAHARGLQAPARRSKAGKGKAKLGVRVVGGRRSES